jgi:type I restriction enzyme S subunit
MSFPRYPKYKDSGVEWLGEVPEHWEVKPLKQLAEFINGDAFKPTEWAESGIPIIRIQNLNGGEDFNYFDGEVEPRYLVHDGDLLFGWSGNRGTSFGPFLWRRSEVCALNQHIFRVVPKSVDIHEMYWTLKAVTQHVEDQAHGIIGMVHITKGDLGAIKVPIPDPSEHTLIATFLSHETAKIDELVAEQRRLIELLKEKRQAVISHAVTKGLNPHAPTKPSGIEWIGDVPEHWTLPPLYVRYNQVLGKMLDQGKMTGEHLIPYLRNQDVRWGHINVDDLPLMDIAPHERERFTVKKGDLLMVEGRELGRSAIWDGDDGTIGFQKALHRLRPLDATEHTRFFYYMMIFANCTGVFIANQSPNEIPHLTGEELRLYRFPKPPYIEQVAIVTYLDRVTLELDTLTTEAQRAIELLQERRTALISAAVTGKIDVRGLIETGGR